MYNFTNKTSSYEEYAPNHFKIKCTQEEFINEIDHNQLNNGHYFIEVINKPNLSQIAEYIINNQITITITWANSITELASTINISAVNLKNNTIYIPKSIDNHILQSFKSSKLWQIEIHSLNTFIITAINKPNITLI